MITDAVGAIANLITAVAAVAAARFAWLGLQSWRHEMLGRRKAELAEEVLASFYELQDIVRAVRIPVSSSSEATDRPREEGESEALAGSLDAYFAPLARLERHNAFFAGLRAKRYRTRALFGSTADAPFQTAHMVRAEIISATRKLIRRARDGERMDERAIERRERDEAVIWGWDDPDDPIANKIESAITEIEKICRPAIEARAR